MYKFAKFVMFRTIFVAKFTVCRTQCFDDFLQNLQWNTFCLFAIFKELLIHFIFDEFCCIFDELGF
jgi:hypothetical protein